MSIRSGLFMLFLLQPGTIWPARIALLSWRYHYFKTVKLNFFYVFIFESYEFLLYKFLQRLGIFKKQRFHKFLAYGHDHDQAWTSKVNSVSNPVSVSPILYMCPSFFQSRTDCTCAENGRQAEVIIILLLLLLFLLLWLLLWSLLLLLSISL